MKKIARFHQENQVGRVILNTHFFFIWPKILLLFWSKYMHFTYFHRNSFTEFRSSCMAEQLVLLTSDHRVLDSNPVRGRIQSITVWQFILLFSLSLTCLSIYVLTLVLLNKLRCHTHFQFSACRITWSWLYKFTYLLANSADPDQLAFSEANWSGSTLFAKAGHIRVQ